MAKLTEHTVILNNVEHTMLLDADDVERYKKAGLIKTAAKDDGQKSDGSGSEDGQKSDTPPANKSVTPPANK